MVNFVTIAVLGPQGLALAAVVVLDDAIGRIQNVGGGTVVLLQADGFGPGKNFFKVQDIFNGSTAELINALIVIANNAYIVGTTGQQAHQVELSHAGILVFVHHDIAELLLVVFPRFGIGFQHLHGMENQIVKVHGTSRAQPVGIGGIDFGNQSSLGIARRFGGDIFGGKKFIFVTADLGDG